MLKRFSALVIAGAALAACSESSVPTGVVPVPGGPTQAILAELTCRVDVAASAMSCAPVGPAAVAGRSSDLILGGQGTYVRLTSTNVVTNPTVSVTADVTVRNLTGQPWNTGNGVTVDTAGVKVFFVQQPTSPVVIANPTGTATFTASGQPYFKYAGANLGGDGILSPGETSLPINWQFTLNGAATFTFGVLIVAKMPDEPGTLRWIGDTLSQSGGFGYKLSVWGSSATDVWAGGTGGAAALHRYNGTSWTAFAWPNDINGLWGTASNNVYGVTASEITRFNGTSWNAEVFTPPNQLYAIWGSSAGDIYAGGAAGTLVHWDGLAWSSVPSTGLVAGETVTSIWGTGASNVYVGTATATIGLGLHRWNGTSWAIIDAGINAVRTIWGSSANDIYVGGDDGRLRRWNGSTWSTITGFGTAPTDAIQAIWGSSSTNVYLVQRNGKTWHSVDGGVTWYQRQNAGVALLGLWGSGRDIFAAGYGTGAALNNVVIRGIR